MSFHRTILTNYPQLPKDLNQLIPINSPQLAPAVVVIRKLQLPTKEKGTFSGQRWGFKECDVLDQRPAPTLALIEKQRHEFEISSETNKRRPTTENNKILNRVLGLEESRTNGES